MPRREAENPTRLVEHWRRLGFDTLGLAETCLGALVRWQLDAPDAPREAAETVDYVRERRMFGQTVLDFQVVQYKLAEIKTDIEALRALVYMATHTYIQGGDVVELASMAKLKAGRLNREVPDTCLQFWGGMGFTWENKVSRMYRDGRLGSIGGGADEVMLGILAKIMGIAKRPVAG